jgi:hypothetical protein
MKPSNEQILRDALHSAIAALESAEPSADTVRLDFIDARSLHIQTCYSESSQVPVYEVCIVHGAIEDDSLQCTGTGDTLREAIDAARLATSSAAKGAV